MEQVKNCSKSHEENREEIIIYREEISRYSEEVSRYINNVFFGPLFNSIKIKLRTKHKIENEYDYYNAYIDAYTHFKSHYCRFPLDFNEAAKDKLHANILSYILSKFGEHIIIDDNNVYSLNHNITYSLKKENDEILTPMVEVANNIYNRLLELDEEDLS